MSNVLTRATARGTWPTRFISIHLTDVCNEKCDFCVVGSPFFSSSEVLDEDVHAFLERYAQDYNIVCLHGGEPTVYPRLLDLLDQIGQLGFDEVHFQTNGRKLANRSFAQALVNRRATLFIVSLHGVSPSVHDAMTSTPGGFVETIKGIENVKALGGKVRTNLVLTKSNLGELVEYGRFCVALGVDHINISNLHPVESAYLSFRRHAVDLSVVPQALAELIEELGPLDVPITSEGFPYCVVGGFTAGQIEGSRRDIPLLWKGSVLNNYDDFMDDLRIKNDGCRRCVHDHTCGGVYREYVEYRGWHGISPVESIVEALASETT